MKRMQKRRTPQRRYGKGTWRTNTQFGAPFTASMGVPEINIIVGSIPTTPVLPGMPEPITEYEISALEGGIEPGLAIFPAAVAVPTIITFGFGIYVVEFDDTLGAFPTQDPLNSVDVCRDNWTYLEWYNLAAQPPAIAGGFATQLFLPLNGLPETGRKLRYHSGSRRIKEGSALISSLNFLTTAGTTMTFTQLFRYHIRTVA